MPKIARTVVGFPCGGWRRKKLRTAREASLVADDLLREGYEVRLVKPGDGGLLTKDFSRTMYTLKYRMPKNRSKK